CSAPCRFFIANPFRPNGPAGFSHIPWISFREGGQLEVMRIGTFRVYKNVIVILPAAGVALGTCGHGVAELHFLIRLFAVAPVTSFSVIAAMTFGKMILVGELLSIYVWEPQPPFTNFVEESSMVDIQYSLSAGPVCFFDCDICGRRITKPDQGGILMDQQLRPA
ncbi:MAG TPA: hypothetical protein VMJ32_06195, partial [Pirellulales bacterium]|nr:hypothetical protein [Pirellulales bacterium]